MIRTLVLGMVCSILTIPGRAGIIASSTFDSGPEGWTVINDALGPFYVPTGGNPGGFIQAVDQFIGLTWYWVAPAKFLGNDSAAYGQTLQFDLRQSGLNNQFDEDDVVLMGNGQTLAFNTPSNPGTSWTSYTVPLVASAGWKQNTIAGAPATEAQLQAVLANLGALRIRGEFITGPDTGDLDNVFLNASTSVPEPGSIALLAIGVLMLWVLRSRVGFSRLLVKPPDYIRQPEAVGPVPSSARWRHPCL